MEEVFKYLAENGPTGLTLVALFLGLLVPKPTHDREIRRADEMTKTASGNADALKETSIATLKLAESVNGMRSEITLLRQEVASLRRGGDG